MGRIACSRWPQAAWQPAERVQCTEMPDTEAHVAWNDRQEVPVVVEA